MTMTVRTLQKTLIWRYEVVIDAQFILAVVKLAVELGEDVIIPAVKAFHGDKTPEQRNVAVQAITDAVKRTNALTLPV